MRRDITKPELEQLQKKRNELFHEEVRIHKEEIRLQEELQDVIYVAHNTREILDEYAVGKKMICLQLVHH